MRHGVLRRLHFERRALVPIGGMFFAVIAVGFLEGVAVRAQTVSPDLRFEVASVRTRGPDSRSSGASDVGDSRA